jgi:hypothetical protein
LGRTPEKSFAKIAALSYHSIFKFLILVHGKSARSSIL